MTRWAKRLLCLCILSIMCSMPLSAAAKTGTVYDEYNSNNPQQQVTSKKSTSPSTPSIIPYAIQFIGSFLFILLLIYVLSKFLSKKALKSHDNGPFHSIGHYTFGNNRSLQLMMIGDTLYIFGVGENVGLIRTIPPGDEQKELLETIATAADEQETKWNLKQFASAQKWNTIWQEQVRKLDRTPTPSSKENETRDGGKEK